MFICYRVKSSKSKITNLLIINRVKFSGKNSSTHQSSDESKIRSRHSIGGIGRVLSISLITPSLLGQIDARKKKDCAVCKNLHYLSLKMRVDHLIIMITVSISKRKI